MPVPSTGVSPAARCVNALGLDLLKRIPDEANALLSPYSIQSTLAMAFAGAAGETQAEMARVLHYPADEAELHRSFGELRREVGAVWLCSPYQISLQAASRLFVQQGYEFRNAFLDQLNEHYGAPLQAMDFTRHLDEARREINGWVEQRTRQRIRDLIPPEGLSAMTRLVLVNALYLKVPWEVVFEERDTKLASFHLMDGTKVEVPTMMQQAQMGYSRRIGFTAVTASFKGALQFVVLLPDSPDGLTALESLVTADVLASCGNMTRTKVLLHLPKFRIEPPALALGETLRGLGLDRAFDRPKGSADFNRMAPRREDDYLFISEVFHKTFLSLDEKGIESAAATAAEMYLGAIPRSKEPVVVRADRPFLFAIQHPPSGACLFLGRVVDPR